MLWIIILRYQIKWWLAVFVFCLSVCLSHSHSLSVSLSVSSLFLCLYLSLRVSVSLCLHLPLYILLIKSAPSFVYSCMKSLLSFFFTLILHSMLRLSVAIYVLSVCNICRTTTLYKEFKVCFKLHLRQLNEEFCEQYFCFHHLWISGFIGPIQHRFRYQWLCIDLQWNTASFTLGNVSASFLGKNHISIVRSLWNIDMDSARARAHRIMRQFQTGSTHLEPTVVSLIKRSYPRCLVLVVSRKRTW